MSRTTLPSRRACTTFEFESGGARYTASVAHFEDGGVAEVFLNNGKINSAADVNARDAAIVCSIALQYGVPVDVIRSALTRNPDGQSSGPLGTALDLIAAG